METRAGRTAVGGAGSVAEAIRALEQDPLILEALGSHVASRYLEAKKIEWDVYRTQISPWELQEYLAKY